MNGRFMRGASRRRSSPPRSSRPRNRLLRGEWLEARAMLSASAVSVLAKGGAAVSAQSSPVAPVNATRALLRSMLAKQKQ